MTYNEFKMCCILFCKNFEGKQYGEVVEKCWSADVNVVIMNTKMNFDHFNKYVNFYIDDNLLFSYTTNNILKMATEMSKYDLTFKTCEDFLNHFKIPSEDII